MMFNARFIQALGCLLTWRLVNNSSCQSVQLIIGRNTNNLQECFAQVLNYVHYIMMFHTSAKLCLSNDYVLHKYKIVFINPLHPQNIFSPSKYIFSILLFIQFMRFDRRICMTIRSFFNFGYFPFCYDVYV